MPLIISVCLAFIPINAICAVWLWSEYIRGFAFWINIVAVILNTAIVTNYLMGA